MRDSWCRSRTARRSRAVPLESAKKSGRSSEPLHTPLPIQPTSQVLLSPVQPAPAETEKCEPVTEEGVARLFDEWNEKLVNGTPTDVANMYWAKGSVLLATLEDEPLVTPEQKVAYFTDFQKKKPSGKINERLIELGCNEATDAGVYTFTLKNTEPPTQVKARYTYTYSFNPTLKQWKITTHHSSKMPSAAAKPAAAPAPAPEPASS